MATNKKKGQRTQAKQLYAAIDEYINNQGNKTFNYKQVSHRRRHAGSKQSSSHETR